MGKKYINKCCDIECGRSYDQMSPIKLLVASHKMSYVSDDSLNIGYYPGKKQIFGRFGIQLKEKRIAVKPV